MYSIWNSNQYKEYFSYFIEGQRLIKCYENSPFGILVDSGIFFLYFQKIFACEDYSEYSRLKVKKDYPSRART